MQKITATIPHNLGRDEAKRRIQAELQKLRTQHGGMLSEVSDTWVGDTVQFVVGAMGQSITGRATVADKALDIEVDVPWLVAQLAGGLKQQIEQRGRQLLAGPS